MIDLTNVKHHDSINELVDLLCAKTQNNDRGFFTVEVAYFLAKMASCMRAAVLTKDRGEIPINLYVIDLAPSGLGKGFSVNIMENDLIKGFKYRFIEEVMPSVAEANLLNLANERALKKPDGDPEVEYQKIQSEFIKLGKYPFTFDSGTTPAVKQLRQMLLMSTCGAINLQIDEIGSNLVGSTEVLNTYLELFDQGYTKQKLTKNTADNQRGDDYDGKTPANMLLFGTPVKLFDGGTTENEFYSFLEIGYARRCLFGVGHNDKKAYHSMTPKEIFDLLVQPKNQQIIDKWSDKFTKLADKNKLNWTMDMPDDVAIKLLEYKIECEKEADKLPEHQEIEKAELSHRYFKALKLAGAYAFVDESLEVTMDHLLQAIKLVEESGVAFRSILTREKSYMKLAKYIASVGTEVTHADLNEALPFYKSGISARNEMISMAQAWGYKQNILIKKSYLDDIEFFKGESLKETNLDKLIVAYSNNFAYDYVNDYAPFIHLDQMTQTQGIHWINHHVKNGHRAEEDIMEGFNTIVLDVDGAIPLSLAQDLLKEYKFFIYTTKRHTPDINRFRMIFPTNYELKMDTEDYKEFINNIRNWLPFEVDESVNQRSKKWEAFAGGTYILHDEGKLFDVLPFIPKTSKNEQYQREFSRIESMDNLERWFAGRITPGNRNNQLLKYSLALADSGLSYGDVESKVKAFNAKLPNPLPKGELESTILRTTAKKLLGEKQ